MRKTVYLILVLLFALIVLFKGKAIEHKEKQDIISISEEWAKNGKPVDVVTAGKGVTYCYEKISGVVKSATTILSDVPPDEIVNLMAGQEFDSPAYSGVSGTIEWVSGLADSMTGLYRLSLKTNRKMELKEGVIVPIRVRIAEYRDKIRVPRAALVYDAAGVYCWVVEDGKAVKRAVRPGLECDDDIQVLEGLQEGDKVCVNGTTNLSENDKVFIRKQEQ
ncbi:MAG: hypothetical protein JXJ19_08870 [Elusimicrobia bacterium]|nr:hypothetical protein [Elusimicrobiota bacterium]